MPKRNRFLAVLGAPLLTLLLGVPAQAGDGDGRTITLITDEGETYVCHFSDDDNIRMVNSDTGEEIFEIDLVEIEDTISEAFAEFEEAFEDIELDIHFDGDENFLRMAADDGEVIVDIDAIIEGVSEAVAALGEIDFVDSHHRFRAAAGMEELENELDALREEMRELKKELKKERRRERH
ncbi:hypothetical protein KKG45_13160 [bacterium]|nr:hypothetical protein [bacterium]MBU1074189.1 hypothetical protein [bacterium]MBU1675210.1 hypothetical protein [bacterium]